MRYRDNKLHGLPVVTELGWSVGKLRGFIVETETHEVVQYVVRRSIILPKLLPQELLIGREQVLSIDNQKMIVKDVVTKGRVEETETSVKKLPGTATGTAFNRSIE